MARRTRRNEVRSSVSLLAQPEPVTFTFDLPPNLNALYNPVGKGRMLLSKEGRIYKAYVGWTVKAQGIEPFTGDISVTLRVYRKVKRGDIDSWSKVLFDAFTGVLYKDDSQISEMHVWLYKDKDNPRVEVTLTEKAS